MSVIELSDSVKPFISGSIFLISLLLICFKRLNFLPIGRAGVALVGSTLMIMFGIVLPKDLGAVVNWDTIVLLLGMMLLSIEMEGADIWNSISKWLMYKCSSASMLLVRVCAICAVTSAILTNDTVCLTMTPIVLYACKHSNLPYLPYLLAVATSSNIGSASLPVGNPQNMIIATESGVKFLNFFKVSAVSSVLGIIVNTSLLLLYYHKQLSQHILPTTLTTNSNDSSNNKITIDNNEKKEEYLSLQKNDLTDNSIELDSIQSPRINSDLDLEAEFEEIKCESESESESMNNNLELQKDGAVIIDSILSEFVETPKMDEAIWIDEHNHFHLLQHQQHQNSNIFRRILQQLHSTIIMNDRIRNIGKYLYHYRSGVVLLLVLIGFCVGLHMGFTVLLGVSVLWIINRKDVGDQLKMVDWELLVFFGGLFILVEGFNSQFSKWAWKLIGPWIPMDADPLKVFIFTILVLISCNIFSNVPLVLTLSPHLIEANAPFFTWLLLAFISTVAGNLTLVGSVANLIVAEKSKKDYNIGFLNYLRFGAPSTIAVIAVGVPLITLIAK